MSAGVIDVLFHTALGAADFEPAANSTISSLEGPLPVTDNFSPGDLSNCQKKDSKADTIYFYDLFGLF